VAKERRNDLFRTEQDCLRLVDEAKQEANITIQSVFKASADSEAKSQRLIISMQKQSEKKIALITHRANKKIESSKMDLERAQQDCQSKLMAALEADRSIIRMTCAHTHELSSLTSKHKSALRDTQARHLLRFEKQKQSMTNEMNRLRELLYGQNEIIDGCLDEMKDEHRAARLASDSVKQLKVIASNQMDNIKWWKVKCNKLTQLKDAYVTQANKMEEMQQKIDEYEIFSELPEELMDSLIVMGRRHADATRRDFNKKLRKQEEKSAQKEKLAKEKKLQASMDDFMNASYLHQQYNSPRCSMTAVQVFREFDKLTSNAARYRYLKEQILIRYVGLGWEEAYHPWSKAGYIFTPIELLGHLTKVVIPLQRYKIVPEHLPMNLLCQPTLPTLGTKASDIVDMDLQCAQQNAQLRIDAYKEREHLEEEGTKRKNIWKRRVLVIN